MKYAVFGLMLVVGVPVMALLAASSQKLRDWLVSVLLIAPALGDKTGINFLSMESYRGPDRGFEVTLADLVVLGLCLAMILRDSARIRWLPAGSLVMALLFGMSVISAYTAPMPLYGWFTVWKLVRMYLLFWCVANLVRTGTDLTAFWRGFVTLGLLFLVMTLKQKYVNGIYRVSGPFDHSNTIPLYLHPLIPLLALWALADQALTPLRRGLTLLAAFSMLFAVYATFSRAGLALAGAALMGALFWGVVRTRSPRALAITTGVVIAVALGMIKAVPRIIERMQTAPESSAAARDEFNHAASLMAAEHSLGVGLNNFSHVLTNTVRYRAHIQVMVDEAQAGVCHHIYWLTAAEMGWIGLAVFLLVIGRIMGFAVVGALRARTLEAHLLGGLALGMGALHLQGFLEWAFRITPVMAQFALVAGLVVALRDRTRDQRREARAALAARGPA